MKASIRRSILQILEYVGYELKKLNPGNAGSVHRPVGNMQYLLEDLKYRGLECKNILDVGANQTLWSEMARKIFSSAKFYLIEPQEEMRPALERFCQKDGKSIYFLSGAGARKETLKLTIWDDLQGSSFLPDADKGLAEIGKQREIQIITIDDLIGSSVMEIPELIKLDIQGFELEALRGASRTFGITEAYILEVSLFTFGLSATPLFSDVVSFMLERNYVVYDFPGFARRPLDGALAQCDICFVKKNGFLRISDKWN